MRIPRFLFLLPLCHALVARGGEQVPITNPGFEEGPAGWTFSKEDAAAGLSQITAEAAHSGANGLRVKQDADGLGSWVQTARIAVSGGQSYRLGFWARCVEDSGIGVWVQFFDADHKVIPQSPDLAFQVPQKAREWTEYHLDFKAPASAAHVTFAVHCYSKHACLADFDDFTLVPVSSSQADAANPTPAPIYAAMAAQLQPPDPAQRGVASCPR